MVTQLFDQLLWSLQGPLDSVGEGKWHGYRVRYSFRVDNEGGLVSLFLMDQVVEISDSLGGPVWHTRPSEDNFVLLKMLL